jgi:hypothetical protein
VTADRLRELESMLEHRILERHRAEREAQQP